MDHAAAPEQSPAAAPVPAAPPASPRKTSTVVIRIVFGAVLLAVSLGLLIVDHVTGHAFGFGVLFLAAALVGALEVDRMYRARGGAGVDRPVTLGALALLTGTGLAAVEGVTRAAAFEPWLVALAAIGILSRDLRRGPTPETLPGLGASAFALLYIWGLGRYAFACRGIAGPGVPAGLGETALLFAILSPKGTDIFCYFVGRYLGKRKIIPSVSPGKTWAGFFGGIGGSVLLTLAFARWTPYRGVWTLSMAVPYGIILGLVAQIGDWAESLLKRGAGVKDSGALVPEFGGVLDIIDSILFAAPVVFAMTVLSLPAA